MTALYDIGFPVPRPVAWNRHTVVMSLIQGTPLYQVKQLEEGQARKLYADLMDMIVRLAGVGLIHGDFNEFNIMIEERETEKGQELSPKLPNDDLLDGMALSERQDESQTDSKNNQEATKSTESTVTLHPILIDLPQMLSISHPNAPTYFDRDVNCVKRYFSRRYHFTSDDHGPYFADVERQMRKEKGGRRLDIEVEASGFSKKMAKELDKYIEDVRVAQDGEDDNDCPTGSESDDSDNNPDGSIHRNSDAELSSTDLITAARQQPGDGGVSTTTDGLVLPRSETEDDPESHVNQLGNMSILSSVS